MSGSISATTAGAANTAARTNNTTGIGADFSTFLTLLTTQLQNQDPTNAMDANQMTQQLVQFASVEQQIKVNTNLERLLSVEQGNQLVSAAPLMGRVVEVESDRLSLQGGQAQLRLPAAGEARLAQVNVLDANGRVLRSAEVRLGSAPMNWSWDGRDANGAQLADGAYRFAVTGSRADGTPATVTAGVLARATAVDRRDGEVRLGLGALSVNFDKLRGLAGG
ncbi:MAG: flagellar hook capping FlgD N-terminal domain-containing protein [Roseococcus sp.]